MRRVAWVPVTSLFLFAVLVLIPTLAPAHPVRGETSRITQPDGEPLEVRIWGDEYYRVVESLAGYTLIPDAVTGEVCFARLSADGSELVSTGVRAGSGAGNPGLPRHLRIDPRVRDEIVRRARATAAAEDRAHRAKLGLDTRAKAAADSGSIRGLVLLIEFPDDPATVPAAEAEAFCNQPGYSANGNNGSVRDYFLDVSDGILDYTNHVEPEYYLAPHNKVYYTDFTVPFPQRARELILGALNDLDARGFDFSSLDGNGDGVIDGINVLYAGDRQSTWASGLWPHSGLIEFAADGVASYRYQMTDIGEALYLYVFCHENGHMLCLWPDLYDYDNDSKGVGDFCLMANGGIDPFANPVEPCAPMKHYSGWDTSLAPTESQFGLTATSGRNEFVLVPHPTSTAEYFMIETIHRSGRNAQSPGSGLAIWHVDENGSNSNQQMLPELHYEVSLLQADGWFSLENNDFGQGDEYDLWYAAPADRPGAWARTECTPATVPDTDWWSGDSSGLAVLDIGPAGQTMSFDVVLQQGTNVPPTARFETFASHGYAPYTAHFFDESLAGDTSITQWLWEFGDGTTAAGHNATHTYTEPGTYRVLMTASNYLGDSIAYGSVIEVREDPGPLAIADIQQYHDLSGAVASPYEGWIVCVSGRVFVEPGTYAGRGFSLADSTGGIQVETQGRHPRIGDRVGVSGRVLSVGGELRLSRATLAGIESADEPLPLALTPTEATTGYEHVGRFVVVSGVVAHLTADSFDLADTTGSLPVRIDAGIHIDLSDLEDGLPCTVYGALASDNGLRNLKPRSARDLYFQRREDPLALTGPPGFVRIAPNPANVLTTLRIRVRGNDPVQLNIHDLRGRRVRTLVQQTLAPAEYDLPWDGTDDNGSAVASGTYFARLSIGAETTQVEKLTVLK